jgi:hypothetical protein
MTDQAIPEPIDGKFIFQIDKNMRVRFNADGWVEEIGKGGAGDTLATRLQGKPNSKLDDIFARRFYDIFARVILLDIYANRSSDFTNTGGVITFKDLEPGSILYERVNLIIAIGNKHFGFNQKPLS